jgi:hypothetical protein
MRSTGHIRQLAKIASRIGCAAPGPLRLTSSSVPIYVPRHRFWLFADGPCSRNRAINETGLAQACRYKRAPEPSYGELDEIAISRPAP